MDKNKEIGIELVKSILFALLFPAVCLWLFFFDANYYDQLIQSYNSSNDYQDLWVLFRIEILFRLICFIFSCYFSFRIIDRAVKKYNTI